MEINAISTQIKAKLIGEMSSQLLVRKKMSAMCKIRLTLHLLDGKIDLYATDTVSFTNAVHYFDVECLIGHSIFALIISVERRSTLNV